jgi:hypothetical protein
MYPRIATDNFLFHVYMPATRQIACGRGGEMRAVIAEGSVHCLDQQTICADCRAVLKHSRTPRSSAQTELFCATAA